MEVPIGCIGCPNLALHQQLIMDTESESVNVTADHIEFMDLLNAIDDFIEEDGVYTELDEETEIEADKYLDAIVNKLDSNQSLINFCETETEALTMACDKGSKQTKKYMFLGKAVTRCQSRRRVSADSRLKAYHRYKT